MKIELRDRDAELAAAPTLYLSEGGRIVCARHGGGYLADALAADPDRLEIATPLDHWLRLSAPEVVDYAARCEDCPTDD